MSKECTQSEYIQHLETQLAQQRKKIVDNHSTADHTKMQGLINDVSHTKQMINFAKSGKMKFYFIPTKKS